MQVLSDKPQTRLMYGVRAIGEGADDAACWQAYVKGAADATIYHDIAWREIFRRALGYRSHLLVAEDAEGKIRGVLPLYQVPSLVAKGRLVAVPFRDRGGIVADDEEAFLALVEAARELKARLGLDLAEIKSVSHYPAGTVAHAGLKEAGHWVRSVVDLTGMTEQSLGKALGAKLRIVKQAIRAELVFEDKTHTEGAVDIWYKIYLASQRSLGMPPFPRIFFAMMIERLGRAEAVNLFVVSRPDGMPIAATLVLHDRQAAIYAYSASLPSERHLRPNDFLLYRLYLWLIEGGRARFDFGADSPSQHSLLRFKRTWLAVQATIPFYYIGNGDPKATDSSEPRFDLARRIIRVVPEPIARAVLARLVRFFG